MAEINLKTLTAGVSEIDVNFNTVLQGQADATIPLNVNLSDGVAPVVPTSVALTGNDLDIIIPPAIVPTGVLFKTIEPSQYTSYRNGDEGWRVQNGLFDYTPPSNPKVVAELDFTSANFYNVLKSPLVVGGISSTTRFTDVNGIQAFPATGNANLVVIDKLTGKMYTRSNLSAITWNSHIDGALTYSIVVNSITYSDWYLATYNEYTNSIHHFAGILPYNDTLTGVQLLPTSNNNWTSTTDPNNTANAYLYRRDVRYLDQIAKGTSLQAFYVTDAKHLITAP